VSVGHELFSTNTIHTANATMCTRRTAPTR
jgi:hypothetical protein